MLPAGSPAPEESSPADSPDGSPSERSSGSATVLDAAGVARVVDRIAHQVLEKNSGVGGVVLLGIPTRGVALARRLAARMAAFEGSPVAVGSLDITLYRDDLRMRRPRALEETELPPGGIDDAVVVLVDDVLFSGRTVRAALDALGDLGRPRAVQLAVLVDRGHRQLPIRADYVGKNLPTSMAEAVQVLTAEDDGRDAVLLGPVQPGSGLAKKVTAR